MGSWYLAWTGHANNDMHLEQRHNQIGRQNHGNREAQQKGTAHIPVGVASHIIESLLEKCERRMEDGRRDGERG